MRATIPKPRDLLTRQEFLAEFRTSAAAETEMRLRETDPLPILRFGRRLLYDRADVLAWMKRQAKREPMRARPRSATAS